MIEIVRITFVNNLRKMVVTHWQRFGWLVNYSPDLKRDMRLFFHWGRVVKMLGDFRAIRRGS